MVEVLCETSYVFLVGSLHELYTYHYAVITVYVDVIKHLDIFGNVFSVG